MIEPKLTFFKIQIKSGFGKSPELGQWHFSDPPEVFESVDMGLAVGKFISAMLNPKEIRSHIFQQFFLGYGATIC